MRIQILIAALLLLTTSVWGQPSNALASRKPTAAWPLDRYLREKMEVPFEGSNPYLVVELEGGIRALFRSESDDEPWGSQAEVAGYNLGRRLGLHDLVPETVTRKLGKNDFPPGDWPYQEEARLGSLQLFLPARPAEQHELNSMPPKDRAGLEILSFLMGRYDNHLGNTLVDDQGHIFIVDFENALEAQQVRYGDYPFVRKGQPNFEVASPNKETTFPFDKAETMIRPTLPELSLLLDPYKAPWSGPVDLMHQLVSNSLDQSLHWVVWDHRLWLQIKVRSRHPAVAEVYPPELMTALRSLTLHEVQNEILLPPFSEQHARDLLGRRDQVLRAAAKAESK